MVVVTSTTARRAVRRRASTARRGPARRGHRFAPRRVWYPAARVGLADVAEPGRLEITAAVQDLRASEGRQRAGDDRLEAHMTALMHVLYVKAHAEQGGSAHFATSYEQIMLGLSRRFGVWGDAPDPGPARELWVRRHRPQLYEWLDVARRSGLIRGGGVKDAQDIWWRTEITLLGTPDLSAEALRAAEARIAGFGDRERDRQRRGRSAPYAAIFEAAAPPSPAAKKRIAIAKARARYQARKSRECGNSGGPSRPTVVPTGPLVETPSLLEGKSAQYNEIANRRSARARPGEVPRLRRRVHGEHLTTLSKINGAVEKHAIPHPGYGRWGDFGGGEPRVNAPGAPQSAPGPAAGARAAEWVAEGLSMAQIVRNRGLRENLNERELLEAVVRAWYLERYGEEEMLRRHPWCPRPPAHDEKRNVEAMWSACALYEAHAAVRPPGWPKDPILALLQMASTPLPPFERWIPHPWDGGGRWVMVRPVLPEVIGYAIAGLRMLARDMAAASRLLKGKRPKPQRPELLRPASAPRFAWRNGTAPQVGEDAITRRRRVRDQLLAAGGNPRLHQSLESMELELIDRERYGLLPAEAAVPSPASVRASAGRWMPEWYQPTGDTTPADDVWRRVVDAAQPWLREDSDMWLAEITAVSVIDGTLILQGPCSHASWVRARLLPTLEEVAQAEKIVRRVRVLSAGEAPSRDRQVTRDGGADGSVSRAARYLERCEAERRRLVATYNPAVPEIEVVARRRSATEANARWDEVCDVAATRVEFGGSHNVNLWLRPLLAEVGGDGVVTLSGRADMIGAIRRHLGPSLEHLVRALGYAHGVRWNGVEAV